jgi:hypothetical protein
MQARCISIEAVSDQSYHTPIGACMIAEGASIEEVASKLTTLPLVHGAFLQAPMIVPLKPYSGFAPRS